MCSCNPFSFSTLKWVASGWGGGMFGGRAPVRRSTEDLNDVLQENRKEAETLSKRISFLHVQIEKELATAKEHINTDKPRARACIRRKNQYLKEIHMKEGLLHNLQTQIGGLESSTTLVTTMRTMQRGAAAMRTAHANMSAEDAEDVMDDIADATQQAEEISNVMSQPIMGGPGMNDTDLEAELNTLRDNAVQEQLLSAGPMGTKIPGVETMAAAYALKTPPKPTARQPSVEELAHEDAELAELERSMSMETGGSQTMAAAPRRKT